ISSRDIETTYGAADLATDFTAAGPLDRGPGSLMATPCPADRPAHRREVSDSRLSDGFRSHRLRPEAAISQPGGIFLSGGRRLALRGPQEAGARWPGDAARRAPRPTLAQGLRDHGRRTRALPEDSTRAGTTGVCVR